MPPAGEVKVRDVNVTETLTTTKDAERRSERPYTTWLAPVLYGVILVGAAFVLLVYVIDTRITRVAETPPAGLDTTGAPGDIL